ARRAEGTVCGLGGALFLEPSGQGWESACAHLAEDGTIAVATGTTCQGQGRRTVCRTVVAEALGVPHQAVTVLSTDTQHLQSGIGALASRGTPIGLTALLKAVDGLKASLLSAAARRLNASPDEIVLTDTGLALAADRSRHIDRAALFGDTEAITLTHTAEGETWGAGAVVAAVVVDTAIGSLTIEEIVAVDDAGRLIDPSLAHGQVVGGAVQGLGEAMMERIVYDDDGQLVTGSFMDYAVPRADDVPPIHSHTLETPSPLTPLGAKGIGEAGTIGVPAAILNATLDALRPLGVRSLDFPLTPHRVWQALRTQP
ncbi:MAG: molybdopterin cofactor-binding domain-containing protein, partial [Pseudomonadota bacterium]